MTRIWTRQNPLDQFKRTSLGQVANHLFKVSSFIPDPHRIHMINYVTETLSRNVSSFINDDDLINYYSHVRLGLECSEQ